MPIKILHTADLHLGADLTSLGTFGRKRAAEKVSSFWRILSYCEQEQVDFLLIAGDFFEGRPDPDLLKEVQERMGRFPDLRVLILPGNHDYYALDSAYADDGWPDNVYIFDGNEEYFDFPDQKTRIYGTPFLHSLEKESLLQGMKFESGGPDWIHIGLFHGSLVSPGSHSDYNPMDLRDLPEGFFSYLALGHVHKRSEVESIAGTSYAYSGNPDGSGFDETGWKGAYAGLLLPHQAQMVFVPFSSRLFIREPVDLTGVESQLGAEELLLQAAKAAGGDSYRDHYYRFYLEGKPARDFQLNFAHLNQELSGQLYYVELRDRLSPALDLASLAEEESLPGFFVSAWQREYKKVEKDPEQVREREILNKALRYTFQAFQGKEDFLADIED